MVAGGADSDAVLTGLRVQPWLLQRWPPPWNWQKMGGAVEGDSSGLGQRIPFPQLEVFGAGDLGSLTTCHTSTVLGVRENRGSVASAPQPVHSQVRP